MTVPSDSEVSAQLERVLASTAFAGAGRHTRLLRYVVERTLAGEGDQLKEYVLGTAVFDRSDDYDPRLDSIVRVEARRLRQRLDDYYATEGRTDQVIISVPRGAYAPSFAAREMAAAATTGAGETLMEPSSSPAPHARAAMVWVVTAAFVVALAAAVSVFAPHLWSTAGAAEPAGIAVLPVQTYSADDNDRMLAERLTDAMTSELARLPAFAVASAASAASLHREGRSVTKIRDTLRVDFVLETSAMMSAERTELSVRLVDAALDRKVWVNDYVADRNNLRQAARQIATEAAAAARLYRARQRR